MEVTADHISVCICTFRRPLMLRRLLHDLARQQTDDQFSFSVVVADNDAQESAREVVEESAAASGIDVTYCAEPRQNIALARNCAVARARGEFIAFIDDDEFPTPTWLQWMLKTCKQYQAAGVLGPVRPHFDLPPPRWILAGRFCERPDYPTGRIMDWEESRSGNLLFQRRLLEGIAEPFNPEFGNGGEDKDFFMRMMRQGHVFLWCSEAVVYETVPSDRWRRRYMLRRALLRGRNILKHPGGRARMLATSMVAVPLYSLILLPMLIAGQHWFMKYCIKLCDHLGRLLAVASINPVKER